MAGRPGPDTGELVIPGAYLSLLEAGGSAVDAAIAVDAVLGARQVKRYGNFNSSLGDFNLLLLEDVPGVGKTLLVIVLEN